MVCSDKSLKTDRTDMFDFLTEKFSSIVTYIRGESRLTEANSQEALRKMKDALLEADVPYEVVESFTQEVGKEVMGARLQSNLRPSEFFLKIIHDKIVQFLGGVSSDIPFSFEIPSVVLMMGLQGAGKTTTIAKLVHYVSEQAKRRGKTRKILVGSVDFYRPAAIDQLEVLAGQVGCIFYRSHLADPIEAAEDIVKKAHEQQCDLVFLDTAGRLQTDNALLNELIAIKQKIKPKYTLMVIDAMTGQESLRVAQAFEEKVGFMGAIMTKMDSNTRGGVAFAFRYALKKPILFVTTGEKWADLESFRPERMANRIVGMGDVATLIEKAEEKIKKNEETSFKRSMAQGSINLEDFARQMDLMGRIGSLSKIMTYMPGMGSMKVSPDMIEKGEAEMKKFRAIISSMTPRERKVTSLLDGSRKKELLQEQAYKLLI